MKGCPFPRPPQKTQQQQQQQQQQPQPQPQQHSHNFIPYNYIHIIRLIRHIAHASSSTAGPPQIQFVYPLKIALGPLCKAECSIMSDSNHLKLARIHVEEVGGLFQPMSRIPPVSRAGRLATPQPFRSPGHSPAPSKPGFLKPGNTIQRLERSGFRSIMIFGYIWIQPLGCAITFVGSLLFGDTMSSPPRLAHLKKRQSK